MNYINTLEEGNNIQTIYMVKQVNPATTKAGKDYLNVVLQDKTGMLNAKVWEPNDPGIDDFEALDYVEVTGEITSFNGALQMNIRRARKVEMTEVNEADYLPCTTKDVEEMMSEVVEIIGTVENDDYKRLLNSIFVEDEKFVAAFKKSSAAKAMHHAFVGGLLEHTLNVVKICENYCQLYPEINRDLLITSALCHDIGKVVELSPFPQNDYTDAGQMIGHIVIGTEIVKEKASNIEGFSQVKLRELMHCILAHHGELEYGSPKQPSIIEALALNMADDTDAKIEMMKEGLEADLDEEGWTLKWNNALDRRIRKTSK
ncbi:MAG: HD domain-containing protein [Eubacterium sp.]|nr:HD domain-containing protein [Eubacterium sp.]